MKIEIITNNENYKIYLESNQYPIKNSRSNLYCTFNFEDDDIFNLIGEKNYNDFCSKGKYQFNVTKKHLDLITGQRSAHTRLELKLYPN